MGKSIRSKSKRSFRAKKREDGVYAAIEAARLQRVSAKLRAVQETDKDGDVVINEEESGDITPDGASLDVSNPDTMQLDDASASNATKKISTHGPRGSRREEWRKSKGLSARPKSRGSWITLFTAKCFVTVLWGTDKKYPLISFVLLAETLSMPLPPSLPNDVSQLVFVSDLKI
ncbi:genomic msy-sf-9 [Pyrrhoderma noxium]|uniref:Genomic msy-sf-9 n=1 Tax=Pyrrhoderma noxium TaxID=2282107 RepID=A0A286UM70_9AGAM|nr:genomic msy-sf-9 [Pyrrhoderma noxium]